MTRHGFSASGRGVLWWLAPVIGMGLGVAVGLVFALVFLSVTGPRAPEIAGVTVKDVSRVPADGVTEQGEGR